MKYVVDTSVLIDGKVSQMLEREIKGKVKIIIPEAAMAELEAQANFGKMSGLRGIEEVKRIEKIAEKNESEVLFLGKRPTSEQIRLAKAGEIDNLIRKIAEEENAVLITSDRVQYKVAIARGIEVIYLKEKIDPEKIKIRSFITPDTASIHLREGFPPYAKRGKIGNLQLVKLRDKPISLEELQKIAHEILEAARQDEDSSIEIERHGATVVQLRDLRIAIAERPFSDRMELTAVRPIAKVSIEEYGVSEELKRRFVERQRGILIAGPPGAGKSTFAASVANYLMKHGFMVKTMESPRDLMVGDEITQYAPLEGDMRLTADLLLLVRPDYTIYDELRKTSDFQVFADMRLAGVGMIGVTHATRAIDAVQRMIGRVELGVIPQVVDTVVFIDEGKLRKIYELKFTVKVPCGMLEADLARPVIEVLDFKTKEAEYEIYTYGEQVVVMPVRERDLDALKNELENLLKETLTNFEVEILNKRKAIVRVQEDEIPVLVGRKGRNIRRIEDALDMSIDIHPLTRAVEVDEAGKNWIIHAGGFEGRRVKVYAGNRYLFTASVGSKGIIKVRKERDAGRAIRLSLMKGEKIYIKF